MSNHKSEILNHKFRPGFTLMELLVVMLIISILVALSLVGLNSAINDARASRTKSVINKIDTLIYERWESFRTRAVPVRIPAGINAHWAARIRLYGLRELMRMELPDRITDVINLTTSPPTIEITRVPGLPQSSVQLSYYRLALRNAAGGVPANLGNWSDTHQGSECLYLILSTMKDHDKSALDFFSTDEVGDVDGDGMKEILDGWGRPIEFLRWAPGYSQHPGPDGGWGVSGNDDDGNGTVDDIFEAGWPGSDDVMPFTTQTRIAIKHPTIGAIQAAPDPYDPLRVDPRVSAITFTPGLGPAFPATNPDFVNTNDTFALRPLVFSAGLDGSYDVSTVLLDNQMPREDFRYTQAPAYDFASPINDPYFVPPAIWQEMPLGSVYNNFSPIGDIDGDGYARGWADNITNHDNRGQ